MDARQLLSDALDNRRTLCREMMVGTHAVRHNIRENAIHNLHSEPQTGRKYVMVTMDHALLALYRAGETTNDTTPSTARDLATLRARSA